MVTFVSLLPYLIVRYFIGGIDPWRNVAMGLSVVSFSAVMCAGAIGASVFKSYFHRIVMMVLFTFSMMLSWLAPMFSSFMISDACGVFYHLNAVAFTVCYTLIGLAMARSGIRLVVTNYEVKPGVLIIGLLIFAPVFISIFTGMTFGFGGIVGVLGIACIAWNVDMTPKAPSWMAEPRSNVPEEVESR